MYSKLVRVMPCVVPVLLLALAAAAPAPAQEAISKPVVIAPVAHDTSAPLRDIVASVSTVVPVGKRNIPLHLPPRSPAVAPSGRDTAIQQLNLPLVGTSPGQNFAGISDDGFIPPDTNGSVGDTQYVQIVNADYAVYDKLTGTLQLVPTRIHNIWNGFSGDCATGDGGDPVVLYDKAAKRWVVGQLNAAFNSYCMAVSSTSDATGNYYRYEFPFGINLPDYPKLGVWPDAYYFSANIFLYGAFFGGADACAFDRSSMLSGGPANMICLQQGPNVASLLPSDLDGSTAPPTGEPNFYLSLSTVGTLDLYEFHVDFATPLKSTFTGPFPILVDSFSEACGGGTCIPQPGTGQQLDSVGDRLMYRLAYRNFGGHEALVVNHSVAAGSSVGVRWYELRQTPSGSGGFSVYQQGTYAPDSNYRWMGSIAMDQAGDIAVGYSESSSSMYPSIFYTGRVPTDPLNSMGNEASIYGGTGSQTGPYGNRWGDYSGMSIDPVDDCTFFYTNEYISAGSPNWNTHIASFKFGGCGGPPPPPPTPPSAPMNLTASALDTYQVSLSWQEASGQNQTGFNIYRCQGAGCTPSQIASVAGNVFAYTDGSSSTPLTQNTTYTYQVKATNGGAVSGPSNTVAATTPTEPPPANLTSTAGQTIRNGQRRDFVRLAWTNHSTDANGNSIERCTGSSCNNFSQIATVGASSAAYTDNTVARFTTYMYRVRAHSPGGYSVYSSTTTVRTP